MIKKAIAITFILFSNLLFSQNATDSLLKVLLQSKEDTNKVNKIAELCGKFYYDNKLDSALKYQQIGLNLAEKLRYKKGIADASCRLGKLYDFLGNSTQSFKHHQYSLKNYLEIGDKWGIALSYYNIGVNHRLQRNFVEALRLLDTGKKLMIEINDTIGELNLNLEIATCYTDQKQYEKALAIYNVTVKRFEAIKDKRGMLVSYNLISGIYNETVNYQKGLEVQLKGLVLAEQIGDKFEEARCYEKIGQSYKNLKQLDKGLEFYGKAFKFFKENNYLRDVNDMQILLSEIYSEKGDSGRAFKYYKEFILIRDSLFNIETAKKATVLEMNYAFEKKEAITKQQIKQKEQQRNYFIGGLILVILFSIFVFRSYKNQRKSNVLLTKQKEELNEKNRIIEDKQKDILDSIRYAKRIQTSLLPHERKIERILNGLNSGEM